MKRRDFSKVLAVGATGASVTQPKTAHCKPKKALMHVGTQHFGSYSDNDLQYLKRHGVNNLCGAEPKYIPGKGWELEEVLRRKDKCEKHGISLDMIQMAMSITSVDNKKMPNMILGKSPERDREIEDVQNMIKIASKAGLKGLKYNFNLLGVLRTERTPGRGGSTYSTWELDKATDKSLTIAGRVPAEEFWKRATYFLERVVPVAEEYNINLACHLHDPPFPQGFRGSDRVLGTVEGMKKWITINDSPRHGFNLCIGSLAEGLKNPGKEIYDIVRYFGERKKIFHVHLRNIKGGRDSFQEVYPDNGDMDFYRVVKVLGETGYPYMVCPDHMPQHPDDPGGRQAFAFGYGFINALIQAVNSEA